MRASRAIALAIAALFLLTPTILAQDEPPVAAAGPAPPGNDLSWNATQLAASNGTYTQSMEGATPNQWWESSACNQGGANVWFRVHLPNATGLRIDTAGSSGVYTLGVYLGSTYSPSWTNCSSPWNDTAPFFEGGVIRGFYYIEVVGGNFTDSSLTLTITLDNASAPYELVASSIFVQAADVVVGEPVNVQLYVQNQGKPLDRAFTIAYSAGWTGGEIRVEPTNNTLYIRRNFTFVPEFAGTQQISFEVDVAGEIPEFNEWNNYRYQDIVVLPPPDATVNITDLRRVPLRTELGDVRHPLALWEVDVQICNLGGGYVPVDANLTMVGGGNHTDGSGSTLVGSFSDALGTYECRTTTHRFSAVQAIGDFTVVAEVSAPRDSDPFNNVDTAEGFTLVAETVGIVLGIDGLLP